jgi:transglutaminase-like putative cysteine protease
MRLRIAHTTSYRYEPAATSVIQILRMTPGSHDGQYVAEWQIDVSTDSRLDVHQDAFGNVTHVLTFGPIEDLTVRVEGLIETHDTGGVLRGTDERFPASLFLRPTALTAVNPAMAQFGRELRAESGDDVLGFLHALMVQINEHMTFDEDPTNSGTSAAEAFALKRGVCQDYAHIFIACARSGGVPARFVSGHFLRSDGSHTSRPATPGRKPSCPISAGSASIRPTASAPPTRMPASPSASTISAPPRARHPLWRRHGDADGRGQGRSSRTAGQWQSQS